MPSEILRQFRKICGSSGQGEDPDGLQLTDGPILVGSEAIFGVGNLRMARIMAYASGTGHAHWCDGPVISIMTARYTTDPSALQPRQLRSDPTHAFNAPFKVGCGHAAHHVGAAGGIQIVRLSDGHSWNIGANEHAAVGQVIGITCEEVFFELLAVADSGPQDPVASTYGRVRLASPSNVHAQPR